MNFRNFIYTLFLFTSLGVEAACVTPQSDISAEQVLYRSPDTWFASEGRSIFEVRGDRLVSTLVHDAPGYLLACGKNDEVLAFGPKSVFRMENAALVQIPAKFPGNLSHTDGKTFYSWEHASEGVTVFSTRAGVTRKVGSGEIGFGAREGYFYLNDKAGYTVFQDGAPIARGQKPVKVPKVGRFRIGGLMSCHNARDGLFDEGMDAFHTLRTAQGDTSIMIPGFIMEGASRRRCSEYVVLMGDYDHPEQANTLWSLAPGDGPPLKRIPTSCRVDSFSLNEDGSLHYRCGNSLYFMDAARRHDVKVGSLPPMFETSNRDRWLAISGYGSLYVYVFEPTGPRQPPRQACFARLVGEKMIKAGCGQITPDESRGR